MMRNPTDAEQAAIDSWEDSIEDFDTHYEYRDNQRVAVIDNPDDMMAFDEAAASGCCGSEEIELVTADGVKFLYGFNYGH